MYTISNLEEDYKYTVSKPLKVIASFSDTGNIRPLYVEYENCTVKINGVLKISPMNDWGVKCVEFLCTYDLDGRYREIKIRYALSEHIWYLPVRNL